jgi:hypothetical protein
MNDSSERETPQPAPPLSRTMLAVIAMTIFVVVVAGLAAVYLYGVVPMMFPTPS